MKGGRRVIMLKVAPPPIGKRNAPWPIKPPPKRPPEAKRSRC